ncbi:MAG: hypothetical protein CM15mP62_07460 [Rhodospirillaceae bacterium]|nr:MAG: hypothetical protein CM15mP62_07460 [Rhodospirillaceae bacterium]
MAKYNGDRSAATCNYQQHEFREPRKPEIMGQFVGCIKGMSEAALKLKFPVVSGNVSFTMRQMGLLSYLPQSLVG